MKIAQFVFLLLVGAVLTGCAAVPERPSEILEGNLPESQMFRRPSAEDFRGLYEIAVPSAVLPLVCKTFGDVRGNPVTLCRKAAKAWVDGRVVSAYPFGERWMIFSGKEPSRVEVLSASGTRTRVSVVGKIPQGQVEEILRDFAFTFNCESRPVEGIVYLYADQACKPNKNLLWMWVPGNNTNGERAMTSGLTRIQIPPDPISLGMSLWDYSQKKPNQL